MTSTVPGRHDGPRMGTSRCAICIATYRRPVGLTRLVQGLERLEVQSCEVLSLEVIIVDNDPAASARGL